VWVLIVVTTFLQYGGRPQSDVQFHDFANQQACETAAEWTSKTIESSVKALNRDLSEIQTVAKCHPRS
jgi:hypothetical protein